MTQAATADRLPEPPPSRETLARVTWAMRLVRDLAATPAVGTQRARRLLTALREQHRASSAAAWLSPTDGREDHALLRLDWGEEAELAHARHAVGARPAELIVDKTAVGVDRVARVALFRAAGPPFDAHDVAWLATTHAACGWAYECEVCADPSTLRAIERLSPRDRETLDELLGGASEKQIAARINRSPHTVHTRVKRIYRQLGVGSRGELLSRCLTEAAPDQRVAAGGVREM